MEVSLVKDILGVSGIMFVTGFLVFVFCLKYSKDIFNWIEHQTLGTRTYILEKLELLFIEVDSDKLMPGLRLSYFIITISNHYPCIEYSKYKMGFCNTDLSVG